MAVVAGLLWSQYATATYQIDGVINMSGDWQYTVYLATVESLDDYFGVKAEHIIATATVNHDGTFVLVGDNLPNEKQFYRLYVIKEEQSEFNACLYAGGDEHNYLHLILDNKSKLTLQAEMVGYAPFGNYAVRGDAENELMKQVAQLVYPSYQFHEMRFPSELQFSKEKLHSNLFAFADTCQYPLVALAAMINTNMNSYYLSHRPYYTKVLEDLHISMPSHPYTVGYNRMLQYHSGDSITDSSQFWKLLSLTLSLCCLVLALMLWRKTSLVDAASKPVKKQPSPAQMTKQEQKILLLIKEGKSNKEIASELYIEVSTVKSHTNRLYAKLGVKNRREAEQY